MALDELSPVLEACPPASFFFFFFQRNDVGTKDLLSNKGKGIS